MGHECDCDEDNVIKAGSVMISTLLGQVPSEAMPKLKKCLSRHEGYHQNTLDRKTKHASFKLHLEYPLSVHVRFPLPVIDRKVDINSLSEQVLEIVLYLLSFRTEAKRIIKNFQGIRGLFNRLVSLLGFELRD